MLLTNEKIAVSHEMMTNAGMSRITSNGFQYGVPIDPKDTGKGLRWKNMMDIDDEEFDTIEEYFLNKN